MPRPTAPSEPASAAERLPEADEADQGLEHAGGADALMGPSPFVGFGPRDVLDGLATVGARAVRRPGRVAAHVPGVVQELVHIGRGNSKLAPAKRDRRFADPAWDNRLFQALTQLHLLVWGEIDSFVDASRLEGERAERAQFAVRLLRDALAPSNGLLTNPVALRTARQTRGRSLVRGAGHLVRDLVRNGGMPQQVDREPFEVGRNLAITPGAVVHRTEVFELLQYTPQTPHVHTRPLVVVPPQVNRFYALDLAPGRSMYEHLVQHGIQLFGISWRNPTKQHRDWGFDTYLRAMREAIDVTREITGSKDVNLAGACAGGIMVTMLLAHLAAKGQQDLVRSASFIVTLLDSKVHADILLFSTPKVLAAAKRVSDRKGVLEGRDMARVFAWLRANDLIWNYWVNNYLLGDDPPAFDILAWNADTTRLPARFHHELIDVVADNQLMEPGALTVLGTPIDVSRVTRDAYVVAGRKDHITPWHGCYRTTQMLGGRSEFVLCSSGHIQTLVANLDNPRLSYYTNHESPPDPDEWLAEAQEQQGSWWPHWLEWLRERSGEERQAPTGPGSESHPAAEPAPGTYVRQ